MYILGINCVYHESSACLLRDGEMIAVAEEERFNRVKHGKQGGADNPDELPDQAIDFCLRLAGITPADVSYIACAGDPEEIALVHRKGLPSAWSNPDDQVTFLNALPRVKTNLAERGFTGTFRWVPHHTAHAASTYFVAPFSEAAVLVVDALGDDAYSTRLFRGRGNSLTCLDSVRYPASIGYLWELLSVFLGFGVYDAAKVMGLASYGNPTTYAKALDKLAWATSDGGFEMANDVLRFSEIRYYPPDAYCEGIEALFGVRARESREPLREVHHDIAAALQSKTDELVLHVARHLHELTGCKNLCLAGGVALNCVTNERVFTRGPFEQLYIQPAANDGGLSLGSAYHVWNEALGHPKTSEMRHAYWGPTFTDDEIESELRRRGLMYETVDDIDQAVAQLISQESVVGYFQGAMELGPRALGNRSILADPRRSEMREILNHKVKHREYFRPFAPSVLHEQAHEWFTIEKETLASDFMLMAYVASEDKRDRIQAVVHVDGTCRVQTVRQATNRRFHKLIAAFAEITGIPMVLNTSFNDQEPIICTPADAIDTFQKTEIDYLALGPFLIAKQ